MSKFAQHVVCIGRFTGRLAFVKPMSSCGSRGVAQVDLTSAPWPTISPQAKDLIRKLLVRDPTKRLTASEVGPSTLHVLHKLLRIEHTKKQTAV